MEETFFEKLIHFVIFLAICSGIVWLGWDEPLGYRFKSEEELSKLRATPDPLYLAPSTPWFNEKKWGSSLDQKARSVRQIPGYQSKPNGALATPSH